MRFFNDLQDVPGQPGHPSSYPEGRTYSPLAKQAVVCPWHRALFEEDTASAEAVGKVFLLRRAYPCLRRMPVCFLWAVLLPACAACSGQIFRRDGRLASPNSFKRKTTGKRGERKSQFIIWRRRWVSRGEPDVPPVQPLPISAVPASLNDYDGVQHDYTRKQGLIWQQIFCRSQPLRHGGNGQSYGMLWRQQKLLRIADSHRELVIALPIELSREEQIGLLQEFIEKQLVAEGMCADAAIHDPYPPGHNPHAHILLTVRPLDEHGKWQYKTEKEYLCVKNGEERGFNRSRVQTGAS